MHGSCSRVPFGSSRSHDRGATSVEYAIMVGGIAAAIVAAVGVFGQAVLGLFERVVTSWP